MSCSHPAPNPNLPSPIFTLPREIRDRIWSYLVTHHEAIPQVHRRTRDITGPLRFEYLGLAARANVVCDGGYKGLPILHTCRQIATEATEVMLSQNLWHYSNRRGQGAISHQLCACKVANIRHIVLRDLDHFSQRPWGPVTEAVNTFPGLRLLVTEMSTMDCFNSAVVLAESVAYEMRRRWAGCKKALKASTHLQKIYVNSKLRRLPLRDGTRGPITAALWEARIALTSVQGLRPDFNQELFDGDGRELDLAQELDYWWNCEEINERVLVSEVKQAEERWAEVHPDDCVESDTTDSDDYSAS